MPGIKYEATYSQSELTELIKKDLKEKGLDLESAVFKEIDNGYGQVSTTVAIVKIAPPRVKNEEIHNAKP